MSPGGWTKGWPRGAGTDHAGARGILRKTGWAGRALVFSAALWAAPGASSRAAAEAMPCPDPSFEVTADDPAFAGRVCAAISDVKAQLAACGLVQASPLTVEILSNVSHPLGECLAFYDCDYALIRITSPEFYEGVLDEGSGYALLPPDVLFRNLLTHELAHALASQSAGARELDIVDQEYIASALELDLMDPDWRDILLKADPMPLPPKTGLIDFWIYAFEPRKFANNVWQHFKEPQNGCDLVGRIVEGEVTFAVPH